jgi:hypothetical protein
MPVGGVRNPPYVHIYSTFFFIGQSLFDDQDIVVLGKQKAIKRMGYAWDVLCLSSACEIFIVFPWGIVIVFFFSGSFDCTAPTFLLFDIGSVCPRTYRSC